MMTRIDDSLFLLACVSTGDNACMLDDRSDLDMRPVSDKAFLFSHNH